MSPLDPLPRAFSLLIKQINNMNPIQLLGQNLVLLPSAPDSSSGPLTRFSSNGSSFGSLRISRSVPSSLRKLPRFLHALWRHFCHCLGYNPQKNPLLHSPQELINPIGKTGTTSPLSLLQSVTVFSYDSQLISWSSFYNRKTRIGTTSIMSPIDTISLFTCALHRATRRKRWIISFKFSTFPWKIPVFFLMEETLAGTVAVRHRLLPPFQVLCDNAGLIEPRWNVYIYF
ncbi:hypothetical protein V6N13_005429 [Hibiscus sabdariffa]|uniref:Maturase K n=1 Tax=Hibiscus sabdariffa TaxID=183260 RepID=A0ABR2EQP3_9ROSI